jgi:ribose transport system substrate-binding protein
MKLRICCLFLSLAVSITLCGCSSGKKYKYRIAVIPKGLTHEHWQSVERGARRAAADLEKQGIAVEVLWDGPTKESDAGKQIDLIDQKLGMGINGLVLAPQHSVQMVPPVRRAHKDGVPVVVIDSNLDPAALQKTPDLIVKYVATDNRNGGRLAGEHLLKVLKEARAKDPGKDQKKTFNLVLLRYAPGSESTEQREQGFLDYVEEQKKKGVPINLLSSDKYAGATVEDAVKTSGPLLNSLADQRIDGIFAVNESSTTGLLNALRTQGLTKKIRVMGFDSSRPLLRYLEDGDVEGLVIQDPYKMGYLGLWTVVQHLEGKVVEGGPMLPTGEVVLTKQNMNDENIRNRFDPALQEKRTIQTPPTRKK